MDLVMPFGKHSGTCLTEVPVDYLQWLLDKADHPFVGEHREEIAEIIINAQAAKAALLPDYTLSSSQLRASTFLQEWLLTPELSCAKLEGGAGYGKSFCVLDVVRFALEQGLGVYAAATSYVATQVLVEQLDPLGVTASTIARALRLEVVRDGAKEDYVLGIDSEECLSKLLGINRLLVVDEYSMISDDIGQALLDAAERYGGKLLVVGDLAQLPPVGQDQDSVLSLIETSTSLSDPMRYSKGSDLYQVEQMARHEPYSLLNSAEQWDDSDEVEVVQDREQLLREYQLDYDGADARVLYYTRRDVVAANRAIRHKLHGASADQLVVDGEKLMVASTQDVYNGGVDLQGHPDTTRYYSGTAWEVDEFEQDVVEGVPCYRVRFANGNTVPVMFMVTETKADPESPGGEEYTVRLRELAEAAKDPENPVSWREWWQFKKNFLPVMYGYATTVHKAQGQTVDRAYIDPRSLAFAGGREVGKKLLYVAATRAKKKLTMVL